MQALINFTRSSTFINQLAKSGSAVNRKSIATQPIDADSDRPEFSGVEVSDSTWDEWTTVSAQYSDRLGLTG